MRLGKGQGLGWRREKSLKNNCQKLFPIERNCPKRNSLSLGNVTELPHQRVLLSQIMIKSHLKVY